MLGALVLTIAMIAAPATLAADEPALPKQTVVYKTVGPTKIEADVYRRNGDQVRPAVVWIHGGALIGGSRDGVPRDIADLCRTNNYVLISLDYRLAPEVKLPAIIDDIKDAFTWIRTEGAAQLHLDPQRILVSGGSAGGYLTMMAGICIQPRPKALVAYWGYGDVDGPWYVEPSPHYRQQPLVAKEDACRVVGREVLTGSSNRDRFTYYLYLRQNGLWTREVTGFDPKTERAKLDPYCPVRNITTEYPPILMVHGTADTDVPYQESADMAKALETRGVWHELVSVEGGGHGLGGGTADKQAIADAHARAIAFIRKQLGD
ncbi:MAG: alpha/beta hydrolase [Planctomycetia bacterium]|nr:alpha/beta hydrolase [Planctomycetia bacterium]